MVQNKVQAANQTRAQRAKVIHDEATIRRAEQQKALKGQYAAMKDDPVLEDIVKKAQAFADYHAKIARDGVGSRKTGDKYESGEDVFETYFLSQSERVSHLDKAAGVLELADYISRQISDQPQVSK